jgi:hypothetical protein
MNKAILWDKSVLFVEDDKVPALERLMGTQRKARVVHLANPEGDVLMGTTIARVTLASYREYEYLLPRNDKLIAAPAAPEISDEQRAANVAKLAKMKEDFIKRRAAKEEKNNGEAKI